MTNPAQIQQARIRTWAEALIKLYLTPEWSFKFDHAKRRAGLCSYTTKTISISKHLMENETDDEIHQVLLHEVAHAIAGPKAGHGEKWRKEAKSIGYIGTRLHHGELAKSTANWLGSCPNGHEHYRFKKPTRALSCAKCSKTFNPSYLITWTKADSGKP